MFVLGLSFGEVLMSQFVEASELYLVYVSIVHVHENIT